MRDIRAIVREWMLPLIACGGVLLAIMTVMGRKPVEKKLVETPPPQAVYINSVAGIGVVEPRSELIGLGVEIPGVVRDVLCKVGQNVAPGQPLFVLDTRDIEAQIRVLEASLASAKIQAEDAAQQFALVDQVVDKRAVSKDELNRKRFAKQLASEKVKEIKAQLQQATVTRERLTVRAPLAGQVLEVNIHPGEYASAGVLETPHIRMGDVSTLVVRTEVDEEFAARIQANQKAVGYPRGSTKNALALTFDRFEPLVKPKQNLAVAGSRIDTRVLQVLYTIDAPNHTVFVGQQMDVFINAGDNAPNVQPVSSPPQGEAASSPSRGGSS